MADLEKVLRGWERCKKCSMSPIAPQEAHEAYYECEYTIGLYCGKDKLEYETIELLDELKAVEPHSHMTDDSDLYFTCGKCGHVIWSESYKFCPMCATQIAWNGKGR